jgi:hypothetical protein
MKKFVFVFVLILNIIVNTKINAEQISISSHKILFFEIKGSFLKYDYFKNEYTINQINKTTFTKKLTFDSDSVFAFIDNKIYVANQYSYFIINLKTDNVNKKLQSEDAKVIKNILKDYKIKEGFKNANIEEKIKEITNRQELFIKTFNRFTYISKKFYNYITLNTEDKENYTNKFLTLEKEKKSLEDSITFIVNNYNEFVAENNDKAVSIAKKYSEKINIAEKKYGVIRNLVYCIENVNSVGGVDVYIAFDNNTNKKIKYINYTCKIKNRVGDYVASEIGGKTTFSLKAMGDNYSDKTEKGIWENICYNSWAHTLVLTNIRIQYFDGTIANLDINAIKAVEKKDNEIYSILENYKKERVEEITSTTYQKAIKGDWNKGFTKYINNNNILAINRYWDVIRNYEDCNQKLSYLNSEIFIEYNNYSEEFLQLFKQKPSEIF